MDELEKKELDAEQLVPDEADDSAVAEADEAEAVAEDVGEAAEEAEAEAAEKLYRELEEIRDMFQEAIDNAEQGEDGEAEEQGELIQELEEFDETQQEEKEPLPICECCNEKEVSTLYGEGYPYCEDCRNLMKHYPLRISGVLSIIAMVVVFALSAYLSGDSLERALVVLEARALASENRMMSVVESLYSYSSGDSGDSKKLTELLVDGFIRTGYISNAVEVIENTFTQDELEKAGNKKYKKIVDFMNNFTATRDAVQGIVTDAFSGAAFDCDELIAELEAEKEKFTDEEKGIKHNTALIEYYKYELLRLDGAELEKQLEILKGIEKEDKDNLAQWIYVPAICEVAAKMGNKELAEEYSEKMKENNAEDMKAYTNLALYYRYLEQPDADSMIALCDEAAKYAPTGNVSYYPTLAMAYLIKGEGALAFDTMGQYMNSSYYTVQNCNLYALLALYCGNTDTYDTMEATLKNAGFEMSDLVVKYKNDKLTIDEVIADMRGDLG